MMKMTKEESKSLDECNKMADCIEVVRKRVIDSGTDATGFSNWCPSESTFHLEVMKVWNGKFGCYGNQK